MTHISHKTRGERSSEKLILGPGQKQAAKATNQEKLKRNRKTTQTIGQETISPLLYPRHDFHNVADALVPARPPHQ